MSHQQYQQHLAASSASGVMPGAFSGYTRPPDDIHLSMAEQEIRHLRATLTALLELINVADERE